MTTTFADHFGTGDHASRPAFGAVPEGFKYACSDHGLIYQSDGVAAWTTWATLGGDVAAHTGDTTDAHDASAVSVLDTGGLLTATDVEAALAEIAGDSDAHIADATDAHAATAISFTPAGTIAATTVQAAIEEVATEAGGGGAGASDDLKQRANSYVLGWTTGHYTDGALTAKSVSIQTLAINRMYFTPLYVPKAITVDRIGIYVASGNAAGKAARLGIYEAGADGRPGALLLDAGEVSAATTGAKLITISQALSADTVFWLVCFTNGSGNFNVIGRNPEANPPYGMTAINDVHLNPVIDLAYTTLPDPAGTVVGDYNASVPRIAVRIA